MKRIIVTFRRTAHVVAASIAVELALDLGAGAAAVIVAPYLGNWVYIAASVIAVGSLPILGLNIARAAHREGRDTIGLPSLPTAESRRRLRSVSTTDQSRLRRGSMTATYTLRRLFHP